MSGLIYQKMPLISKEIGVIGKDRIFTQGARFNYRGIDDVLEAAHGVLIKHGVFAVPEVLEEAKREYRDRAKANGEVGFNVFTSIRMRVTFYAEDGSSVSCVTAGEGMDTADKSTGKSMSTAYKYAFFLSFCIPVKGVLPEPEDDGHDDSQEPVDRNGNGQNSNGRKPAATNMDAPTKYWAKVKEITTKQRGAEILKSHNGNFDAAYNDLMSTDMAGAK